MQNLEYLSNRLNTSTIFSGTVFSIILNVKII